MSEKIQTRIGLILWTLVAIVAIVVSGYVGMPWVIFCWITCGISGWNTSSYLHRIYMCE